MKPWPIRLDPTTTPSRRTSEPFALAEKPSCAMPVIASGYRTPTMTVNVTKIEQGGKELAAHQTSPVAPTMMSISLIPMKGAITPPAP